MMTFFKSNLFNGFALVIATCLISTSLAKSETLVTDLSQHTIEITSRFSGSELLLFGALERHAHESTQSGEITVQGLNYDIIVVVQSEPTDLIIRKKENIAGIWVNNENQTIQGIPGYYVIESTRPLDQILSKGKLAEYGLGLQNIGDGSVEAGEYKEALIRNMIDSGLYLESSDNVTVRNEILFRANLTFPSNMPVGDYKSSVYLVRDGDIILEDHSILPVNKRGIERVIYNFAHDYPPYYGIMAIIVAISAGLFSGYVAKKLS